MNLLYFGLFISVYHQHPSIEEVICRFPHISEQIFEELEDSSLARCRETNRLWQGFMNNETFYKKRIQAMIDKEIKSYEEEFDIPKGSLTPLHSAAMTGQTQLFIQNLESKSNQNPTNEASENTPLH